MRTKLALLAFLGAMLACAPLPTATQIVIMITATPAPTRVIQVTATANPTQARTATPRPSATPSATPDFPLVTIEQVESALGEHGYRRYPFALEGGLSGFTWTKDSGYENVETISNGFIEIQVLHDQSPADRDEHVERKLEVFDTVFPPGFMQELRELHRSYNGRVASVVSGQPTRSFAYPDEFNTVWAQYYSEFYEIGNYGVEYSLWWWQSTCPARVPFCYYIDFPGLEFTGDSSFVFYTVNIYLPGPESPGTDST